MVQYRSLFFILLVLVLLAGISCTKPVLIGSDFLDDEQASLDYKENFSLSFFTEKTDSVVVHSDNVSLQLSTYLIGNVQDPVFGNYTAEIYAQPILPTIATSLLHSTLDSVILQLAYDTLGSYGSLNDEVTLEVFRMIENPDFKAEYFSNQRFATNAELLGSLSFVPKPRDSVTITTTTGPTKIAPSIRIPLSIALLNDITDLDSTAYVNQDTFISVFNGLHIRMSTGNNTMLGFRLSSSVSALSFYYDKGTTTDQQFSFPFTSGSVKTVYMEHNYNGSIAEPSLGPEAETDYWFVQGLSGLTTRLTIDDLSSIGNAIINQADLEVYGTFLPGDLPDLYPAVDFMVTQELTDTSIINSIDVNQALVTVQGNHLNPVYDFYYGGTLEEITPGPLGIYKYSMKVTAQVKDIFLGKKENIIYFNPFEKANVPNRSVMFGPGHPDYAPRLRIYYTSL